MAAALALVGCGHSAPKGQVLATVNGQEITAQDVAAEGRARGGADASAPVLLQSVVGRVLLAQAAHRSKLDSDPGFPSDMARLREDYLARRMLQRAVRPASAPTPAQVAQTISSHPFQFGRRMRVELTQLKFSGMDALQSIEGLRDLAAMANRLRDLGVTYEEHDRTLDTAELPDSLAARLAGEPEGAPFTLREGPAINEVVVRSRQPVDLPVAQQQALGAELARREAAQRQIQTEVDQLERQAHIAYQHGYAPPQPGAKAGG